MVIDRHYKYQLVTRHSLLLFCPRNGLALLTLGANFIYRSPLRSGSVNFLVLSKIILP